MPRINACMDCGARIAPQAKRCKTCWGKTRQGVTRVAPTLCADCGKPLSKNSQAARHEGGRCWNCHRLHLTTKPMRLCSKEGCGQPHEAHGLCRNHYKASKGPAYRWGRTVAYRVAYSTPCAICAYNRLPSHVHRANGKEGYRWGNVVPLCARCHREVEEGLAPCPKPLPYPSHVTP